MVQEKQLFLYLQRSGWNKKVNNRRQTWIQEMGGVEIKISGQILQQMTGEEYFGLNNPKSAYEAGLFHFNERKEEKI